MLKRYCLLALLAVARLAAEEVQTTPFALKVVTPEFTSGNWWRFLGVGINYMADPQYNAKGQLVHKTNEWYLTGKGTPLLDTVLGDQQEVQFNTGVLVVSSTPNDRNTLTKDPNKLLLQYRVSAPVSRGAGATYIVVSGNAPMPAVLPGESLQLSFWVRGDILKASTSNLVLTGYATNFGGDIFSEAPMRAGLSYHKDSGKYGLPEYRVVSGTTELQFGPSRTAEFKDKYTSHFRVHSADSARGLASRNGFVVSTAWSEVSTKPFTVDAWDIGTKVTSFELVLQLPYDAHSTPASPAQWENIVGTFEIAGVRWYKVKQK